MLYQLSYIGLLLLPESSVRGCITSFRRTQVFTANSARMARVMSRTFSSDKVVHDRIPNPTNAANANTNRFTVSLRELPAGISPAGSRPLYDSTLVHREGFEPSYLRRGADLQSAGFNHSPTCAEGRYSALYLIRQSTARIATSVRRVCRAAKTKAQQGRRNAQKIPLRPKPQLEKASLRSAARNLPILRRAKYLHSGTCYLELAKGFEPLTL